MDIIKLRAFFAVAKLKSISRAAGELNYTEPAISYQIRALENMLNVKLFQKEGRKIGLTEAGRMIFPFVKRLLHDYDMIISAIPKSLDFKEAFFRIGASSLPGVHLVPQILSEFIKFYPNVSFSLSIDKASHLERMILDRRADIIIIGKKRIHADLLDFNEYLLRKDELVVVAASNNAFGLGSCISVENLSKIPLILPQRDVLTRRSVEERFHQLGYSLPIAFEVSNIEAIKQMVSYNLGVTVLPRLSVEKEIEAGWLVAMPVIDLNLYRYIYLISRKEEDIPTYLQLFINFIIEKFSLQ
ncbi:MAG TPA: LysR family transcriptional regulator [Rectinema sp.]|nr:LysR family transcriptional regulator [Rectinema sp.]